MMTTRTMTAAIVLAATLTAAGAAGAQDQGYFQQRADQALQGETVALRWTVPFGDRKTDRAAAPSLALSFSQASAEGSVRMMDVASLSFASNGRQFVSPFQNNFGEGAGHWIAMHPYLATLGAGLILVGVAEATKEEDTPDCRSRNSNSLGAPLPEGGSSAICKK